MNKQFTSNELEKLSKLTGRVESDILDDIENSTVQYVIYQQILKSNH